MTSKLAGKVALVTGAGRGIGRAVALKLASEGAKLVANDLDAAEVQQVVAMIRDRGGEAVACVGNVTDPEFAERFIATAMDRFTSINIIVNNAGYSWDNVIQKTSDEQWQAMLDCHLTAPFKILRAAQPHIKALAEADRGNGVRNVRKIVNTSSMAGMYGLAGAIGYSTGKAGILGLTKTLAKEWGRFDVTVNSVAYGLIETRLAADIREAGIAEIAGRQIKIGLNSEIRERLEQTIPLGRVGTTEEAAGAVYLLCIPESDYVSGHTLMCTGGLTAT